MHENKLIKFCILRELKTKRKMEIDKEKLSQLSNDELFKLLKKNGLNAGPITASTRSVYEKRLKNYYDTKENNSDKTTKVKNHLKMQSLCLTRFLHCH